MASSVPKTTLNVQSRGRSRYRGNSNSVYPALESKREDDVNVSHKIAPAPSTANHTLAASSEGGIVLTGGDSAE